MFGIRWIHTYGFFSIVVASVSLVMVVAATAISFSAVAPHLAHYTEGLNFPLYAHVLFGPLALILAPFQFWQKLRARRPLTHRIIGYTYAISILVAGLGALAMLTGFQGTLWAGIGFLILDIGWVGTTAYAINLARKRDIVQHRRWMMRSAALTFAAVTLRLQMIPLVVAGWSVTETYNITAWLCWLVPLGFVEWRLRMNPASVGQVPAE